MRMFDWVNLKEDEICPNCKSKVNKNGFKTNDFNNMLSVYTEGKDTAAMRLPLPSEQEMVEVYNCCDSCRKIITVWMKVEDNTLIRDKKDN